MTVVMGYDDRPDRLAPVDVRWARYRVWDEAAFTYEDRYVSLRRAGWTDDEARDGRMGRVGYDALRPPLAYWDGEIRTF